MNSSDGLSAGDKFGPCEILAPIGEGSMGAVHRAHDPRLKRDVAIKVSAEKSGGRFELVFLAGVRLPFVGGAPSSGVVVFSVSIVFVLIVFLLDRVAVVTIHRSEAEKSKANLRERSSRL